jgi:hypothetical protein
MAHQTVWSTAKVEETLEKYRAGLEVDLSFFHDRNTALKGSNVLYNLTGWEEDEFVKCSEDISYFVTKYCKFLTDKGQTTIALNPYQNEILETCGEEEWLEDLEEFAPANRNFILMAARQTGKCQLIDNQIVIRSCHDKQIKKVRMIDLYNIVNHNVTLKDKIINRIKTLLYKIHTILDKSGSDEK